MSVTELTAMIGACGAVVKIIWDMVQSNRNIAKQIAEVLNRMDKLEVNQKDLQAVGQANSIANRNLTRYRIRQEMLRAIKQGYESYDNFQEVVNLIDGYHATGGNGAIDALYEEYKRLPRKDV
ncbi:hypothetical protein [Abiotrophia defectiva]|uniref:hypothetical protein n=1 Tax=Abiotrophia defectiva TaxID=46125 RepID=UPI0028E5D13A|nr:hypothetical protein [Abiotrophia defectiva]